VTSWRAITTVFFTSAAVLVLEIIASRMMAPYVGISLETYTGIIGTVLAGIAVGAGVGGRLADARDPRTLLGPALIAGGALTWLSMPIVAALGPQLTDGPVAIVTLTTAAFFLPAAVLSAVSPMIAKIRLDRLDETGSVVGGLSAAGTVGGLAGTFLTGFVLLAALPSRPVLIVVGGLLIVAGMIATWVLRRRPPAVPAVVLAIAAGLLVAGTSSPCQYETAYFCVRIEADPDNPSGRSLYLDRLRHAYVDLDDPTDLDIRYIRLFRDVAATLPDGPIDVLHIGGGGFTFPRYLDEVRPGSQNRVLEIDDELVRLNREQLGLVTDAALEVRTGDARLALDDEPSDSRDLVVGDAFGSTSVPWHLTTAEVIEQIDRILRPDGIYVMNVLDGGDSGFARAEMATLADRFAHVAVIVPADGVPRTRAVNQVLLASQAPLPDLDIDPADGQLLTGDDALAYLGDAMVLTDDFAPVDRLLF
jgi:spermidine synthase